MEPLQHSQDRYVREQLQRHEFPFDEAAWNAMQTLLAEHQTKGTAHAPGKRRWHWLPWILALAVVLLLFWFRQHLGNTDTTEQAAPAEPVALEAEHKRPRHPQDEGPGDVGKAPALSLPGAAQHRAASYPAEGGIARRIRASSAATTPTTALLSTAIQAPVHQAAEHTGYPHGTASSATDGPLPSAEQAPEASPSAAALAQLPPLPIALLHTPELRAVLPRPSRPSLPTSESGCALGLLALTPTGRPVVLTPAFAMSYFTRRRFSSRAYWHAEAQLKVVSRYPLRISVSENTPTGSFSSQHQISTLLFFDLPVGIHYRMSNAHGFLFGARLSANAPVGGSSSVFIFGAPDPMPEASIRRALKPFDVGLAMGWEWRMSPHWAFDTRFNYGLTPLVYGNLVSADQHTRNTDAQMSLRYFFCP